MCKIESVFILQVTQSTKAAQICEKKIKRARTHAHNGKPSFSGALIEILEDLCTSGAPGVYIGGILMRRAAQGECLDVPSVES